MSISVFTRDLLSAIRTCYSRETTLIVFVDGGDETGQQLASALESHSTILEENGFLVLTADVNSKEHRHFEGFYGRIKENTVTFLTEKGAAIICCSNYGSIDEAIQCMISVKNQPDIEVDEYGYPSAEVLKQVLKNIRDKNKELVGNGSAISRHSTLTVTRGSGSSARIVPDSEWTVLQIRSPDGASMTKSFRTSSFLSEVKEIIGGHFSLSDGFGLATSYPRYHYCSEDYGSNLRELNLWPNAVLLIVPADPREANENRSLWSYATSFTNWPYAIVMYMWNRISGLFSFRSIGTQLPATQGTVRQESDQPRTSAPRRRGNIHTLRDTEKDEDDNKRTTYNGNSTQQL